MTRDQILQIVTLRRAQGLQDSVPEGQFLAELAAEVLDQETTEEAAA
jgi:hypothetical protein